MTGPCDAARFGTLPAVTAPLISYVHWIYFPTEEAAAESTAEFAALGGIVTSEQSASGDEWLVRVKTLHSIDDLGGMRDSVRRAAELTGGEYDGGEAGPL
jgi:hypothetical protein